MREAGIGLVFISIGDNTKLKSFLEANPEALKSSDLFLVDGYDFTAYKAVGLRNIGDDEKAAKEASKRMKAPELRVKEWISYIKTVGKVSPVCQYIYIPVYLF